jgi:hypothetical protein
MLSNREPVLLVFDELNNGPAKWDQEHSTEDPTPKFILKSGLGSLKRAGKEGLGDRERIN